MSPAYSTAFPASAASGGAGTLQFLAVTQPGRRWRIPEGFFRFCFILLTMVPLIVFSTRVIAHHLHQDNEAYASEFASAEPAAGADRAVILKMSEQLRKKPDALRSFSGAEVLAALNQPALKRTEGESHIWQYKGKGCILDVFLNGAEDEQSARVVHYEVRPHRVAKLAPSEEKAANGSPDARGCVTALLEKAAPNKALALLDQP
jgi:hypothetical protein